MKLHFLTWFPMVFHYFSKTFFYFYQGIKKSNFLKNSEILLETRPKNVISWISPKEQNIGSFKIMVFLKLEIQHRGSQQLLRRNN